MLEALNGSTLEYEKLSQEEMKSRGILGRLVGVCADFKNATRNGRKYSEQLWEKTFANPIMKERIEKKVCFGELGHPTDGRTEPDMEKVAVCMAEPPKKGSDGKLRAVFDILNTPNGKLLKSLCDYGSVLGISSRGSGDTYTDYMGEEAVDPDTYDCTAFDVVLVPGVKEARLQYVTEALEKKRYNKTLRESLQTQIDKASDDEKKIMEEALNNLGVVLNEDEEPTEEQQVVVESAQEVVEESVEESKEDIKDESLNINEEDTKAVDNNEAIVKELQEALQQKSELEKTVATLNEKLSVCYAKEAQADEKIEKLNSAINSLKENVPIVEGLRNKETRLTESLNEKDRALSDKEKELSDLEEKIGTLTEGLKKARVITTKLKEDSSEKDSKINELTESLKDAESKVTVSNAKVNALKARLTEAVESTRESYESKIAEMQTEFNSEKASLNEALENLKKEQKEKFDEYSEKLQKSNALVEKYRDVATASVNRYIESKADMLGVEPNEIKNRLSKSYSFDDIDSICEDLQKYQLNMSRLPFGNFNGEKMQVKISESKNSIVPKDLGSDDMIDSQLLNLMG